MPSRLNAHPRAHFAVAGLLLAATAMITPSAAQAISDRRDQPTPADVPQRSETGETSGDRPVGTVAPPSAISTSTAVTASDRKGKASHTNPLDLLPERDRAGTGGRGE